MENCLDNVGMSDIDRIDALKIYHEIKSARNDIYDKISTFT